MVIFKEKKSRMTVKKSDLRVTLDARDNLKIKEFKQALKNLERKKKKVSIFKYHIC